MIIKSSFLLLSLLLFILSNCEAAFEDQVKKINKYMQDKNVAPNKVDLAFEKAQEYRDNEATKKESLFSKRDQLLIVLLDRFLELKPIRESENNCGYESLGKIRDTSNSFMSASKTPAEKQRLINKILKNYTNDHALKCDPIHPKDFERIYSQLDTKLVERVESFMYEAILHSEFQSIDPSLLPVDLKKYYGKLYYNFIQEEDELERDQRFEFLWFHDYEFIYKELKSHAAKYGGKEEDLKYLLEDNSQKKDEVKVREIVDKLFDEYLRKPCKYYVENLGPEVFFPAIWEGRFLRRLNPVYRPKEENAAYILGWAQFQNCFLFFTNMNTKDVRSAITEVAMSN